MKYNELIHFEPVETVIQLIATEDQKFANELLNTYVISDRMAEIFNEIIFPQLQFHQPVDNKGLIVVGNYGTGKSHMMSVIATIAEHQGTAANLQNPQVAENAVKIEGQFKVIRSEIGSSKMTLRDLICNELEKDLEKMGVNYNFPEMNQVSNNKDAFVAMMGAFHQQYPDKGLLLVVDELLEFLRSRNGQEVILDLTFLRELGEICRHTRFRFITGVQEMLFDSPSFQFVAEQLRRVRERFEQVSIVREDIAYVVSERLLKKDDRQKSFIREHLSQFTPLYHQLNERMEEYVNLFPIHPHYLSTFEKVIVAEKREILKTISGEMKKLMDLDVPENKPGTISYDSYWTFIEADTSLRSNPDIRKVIERSKILQDKVENAFTRPAYKPAALRIIRALSVNRLTTGDIYTKMGLTATELRDQLMIHLESLPEQEAEFLQTTVETILREILKTVSWQYISTNESNGQYYIDIDKDIPVDNLIEEKAETLSNDQLDRYYFEIMEQLTERSKNTYVSGHKIWAYELPWNSHKVSRQGYLFFGAPNERSTAHPPRDFYMYVLQLFEVPRYTDEKKSDEVFFRLKTTEDSLLRSLRLYAGSKEMALTSAGTKHLYEDKARGYLQEVTHWLQKNFTSAFEVTFQGTTKKVVEWAKGMPGQSSIKEIMEYVSSHCLEEHFLAQYPEYPSFGKLTLPLTEENKSQYIQDAYRAFGGNRTRQGTAILDGFVMLENDKVNVRKSGYAKWVIDLLNNKNPGQVVNRGELIETIYTVQGTQDVELTTRFRMEPDLFTVVLVALVHQGEIVLTINGTPYDAMKYDQLVRLPINDIAHFSHLKRPSEIPMPVVTAVLRLLDINEALLRNAIDTAVVEMNSKSLKLTQEIVQTIQVVKGGIPCWEGTALSPSEKESYIQDLTALQQFLQGLQVFNTAAKLKNIKFTVEDVEQQQENLKRLHKVKKLQQRVQEVTPMATYLTTAMQQLPIDHPWQEEAQNALDHLLDAVRHQEHIQAEIDQIKSIQQTYKEIYSNAHAQARLNASQDNHKSQLQQSREMQALKQLKAIQLLPVNQFDALVNRITQLQSCWNLTPEMLNHQPVCSHCKFRPKDNQGLQADQLGKLEEKLETMLEEWTETLLTNLSDPQVKENISLLKKDQEEQVKSFLEKKSFDLPLEPSLIDAIKTLLEGIEKVEITTGELVKILGGGSPLTIEETRQRFDLFINQKTSGRQKNQLRIMLKE